MYVVVIHGWQKETPELVQAVAGVLGVAPFEVRQRMIGGGPTVVTHYAEMQAAKDLAERLTHAGLAAVIVDSATPSTDGRLLVRLFALGATDLQIETHDGTRIEIPYAAVELLLVGTNTVSTSETETITERKLSLGKTLLSGGIPMTKKVTHQEEVISETRGKYLYLYAGERPPLVCGQQILNYEGLGSARLLSREANFGYLLVELRRRCSDAVYDERLLNRMGLTRLLGPVRDPATALDLAAAILACILRG